MENENNNGKRKADNDGEVTLVLKKQRIRADKDKLVRYSEYFAALFSRNFSDHEKQDIDIKYEISLPTLQVFVDWCNDDGEIFSSPEYHFDVKVSLKHFLEGSGEQLLELLNVGVLFSAEKLVEDITQILICTRSGPEIMLDVWATAEDLGLKVLGDIAFATCLDRFEEIPVGRLLKLPKESFFRLVNNMNVRSSSHHMLYVRNAWLIQKSGLQQDLSDDRSDAAAGEGYSGNAMEHSEWYFEARADSTPADNIEFETRDAKCLRTVYETIRPQFMPCVTGRKLDDSLFVWAFDDEKGEMEEIAETAELQKPTDTSERWNRKFGQKGKYLVGRQVIGRAFSIYVIGGEMGLGTGRFTQTLWRYCLLSKKWYTEAILPRPRRHMAVAFLKNKLYLFGGVGRHRMQLTSVDVYNIYTGEWSEAAEIPATFTEVPASCVSNGRFVYWKTDINIFDPIANKWERNTAHEDFGDGTRHSLLGLIAQYNKPIAHDNVFSEVLYSVISREDPPHRICLNIYNTRLPSHRPGSFQFELFTRLRESSCESWAFADESRLIYQQFWSGPWLLSFGYEHDKPNVEVRRLKYEFNDDLYLGAREKSDLPSGEALTNVAADCFKFRLGCFNIINPDTLHRPIPSVIFKLCSEPRPKRRPRSPTLFFFGPGMLQSDSKRCSHD